MNGKGLGSWKKVLKSSTFKEGPDENLPPYVLPNEQFKDGTNVFRDKLYQYLAGIYPDEDVINDGYLDLSKFYQETDDANVKKNYKSERNGVVLFDEYPDPLCGRKVFVIKFNVRDGKFVEWNFKDKKFVHSTVTKSGDYIKTKGQYATGLNKKIGYVEETESTSSSSSDHMFDEFFDNNQKEEEEEQEKEFEMNWQRSTVYFNINLDSRLIHSIKELSENKRPNFKKVAIVELKQNGFTKSDDNFNEALSLEIDKQKLKWEKSAEVINLFCTADMPFKQTKTINGTKVTWWTIYVYDTFFLVDPDNEEEDI